ncbi:hypothetical protein KPL71_026370 [Citrus sinensis]|uniref:Uncharacterized protein n=1 Tax=Citrus sinensis TaxID=2711 RepID=A0ACB8HYW6_CITSI|nr:hypothetical protein KPL71_026370 [Citrus sinensis]
MLNSAPIKKDKAIRLLEHLQATTDYSPHKDEIEFYFSEQEEPTDETVFALQNSSDDSENDEFHTVSHQQLLSIDTTIPIPSIKLHILPSKFQRPIPAIGLLDTGAQRSTQDDHRHLLNQFLNIIQSHGIMLSAKENTIATNNIEFLEMTIKDGHYQPGKHTVSSTEKESTFVAQQPHTCCHNFKANCANSATIKAHHRWRRILQTDASDESWGAILLEETDGKEHFIAYASGHFSDTQIHYHSVFKEILAVKHGIQKFEYHLIGYHFLVRMDNSTFPNIMNFKGKNVQEKMLLKLKDWFSKYDFSVKHIKGDHNLIPDMLSRLAKPNKSLFFISSEHHFPVIFMATSLPSQALTQKTFPLGKTFTTVFAIQEFAKKVVFRINPGSLQRHFRRRIMATTTEQYVTLEIPPDLISNWKREGYTHLHIGGVRLILTLRRKGLPVTAQIAMLDTRFTHYQDAVIGTVLTTLHAGTVLLSFYPNFNLSLQDPNLSTVLQVQVQIQGVEQISFAKIATLHHQLDYRLQNHALDLPTPEHHSDALMVLADSDQIPTIIQIPRQIPKHELIKLMPLEWISNYEKFHTNSSPIETIESLSGNCDPDCPCWDDWDEDDNEPTRRRKPKRKLPKTPCSHHQHKPPHNPPPPPAPLPIYQKELKWIAKNYKTDILSNIQHSTPPIQPMACMMFSSTSHDYSSNFPALETHTDPQQKVITKPFIPSAITPTGHLEDPKPFEDVLNWQTQNARAQNETLVDIYKKVNHISLRTDHLESKMDSITSQMQQIYQNLQSRISQLDSELRTMLSHRYIGPEFDQKEKEIRKLKAELEQIESESIPPLHHYLLSVQHSIPFGGNKSADTASKGVWTFIVMIRLRRGKEDSLI